MFFTKKNCYFAVRGILAYFGFPKNNSMNIFTRIFFKIFPFIIFILICNLDGFAQCVNGNNNSELTFACNSEQTFSPQNVGDYRLFSVIANVGYNFNSNGTPFNSYMYARQGGVGGTLKINQDANNIGGDDETVNWIADFTGFLGVAIHQSGCGWPGSTNSAVLRYRQLTTVTNTTSNAAICMNQTKSLSATLGGTHNNPAISWAVVAGPGNGTISGTTFTPTAAGSVTIRATVGVCFSDVTFTINTLSTAPTSIGASPSTTICSGNSVTLTATGGVEGSGVNSSTGYQWYSGSCGGTPVSGTGSTITVTPTTTTTYFVRRNGTCNQTTCASVTITVNTLSSISSVTSSPTAICPGGSSTVSVTGTLGTGAGNWNWFTGSCGGTPAGSGASINVSPGSTTTYYVQASGTCNTVCQNTTVTVNTLSTDPTAAAVDGTICAGQTTTLNVTAGSLGTGAVWRWYTSSCGGTLQGTGASITVSPSITTTYYVRGEGTCNTTNCAEVTVTVRPTPTASITSSTSAVCLNDASPTVTITNPQTLPVNVTYNLNGGTNTVVTIPASSTHPINVPTGTAGTFTYNLVSVAYTTSPNCTNSLSSSATVVVRPIPTATISGSTTVCQDGSSPSITFNNPQTLPVIVTYNVNGGSNQTQSVPASSSSTVLVPTGTAGTFNYNLVSVAYSTTPSCSNSVSGTATVVVRPTPAATISGTTAVCLNAASPAITITNTTSLTETIVYTINGSPQTPITLAGGASQNISVPTGTAGTFTYALFNAYYTTTPACTTSVSGAATVTVNPLPVLQETHTHLSCLNSNDGVIILSVTPPGTTPPYYFSITGGSSFQGANNGTFTGLAAGTYNSLLVEDANGCRSVNPVSVTLTEPPQLNITIVSTEDASCNGVFDGSIQVAASGGTPGYMYSLNGGPYQPGATFTNLQAGDYTITVRDNNDCEASTSTTLNNEYIVTASISDIVNVSCPGNLDGAYTINGAGGTGPYQYANNGILFGSSNTFTGLAAGNYTGFVRDSRGCLAAASVTINSNPAPTAIITGNTSFCAGGSTLLSGATSLPGAGSIVSFEWFRNGVSVGTGPLYNATLAGNYTLTVVNSNGCSNTSATTTVTVNPLPTVNINPFPASTCLGTPITLIASGANTYSWSPSTGLNTTTGSTVIANPSSTITYTVTGTDLNGCQNTASRQVVVNSLPTVSVSPSAPAICNGGSVQLTASGANSYTWSPATGLLSTSGATVTAQPTTTTTYTVTGTSLQGCTGTANVTVTVNSNPGVTITASPVSGVICLGQSVTLTSNFGSGNSWSTGETTQSIIVTPSNIGTYTYNLLVTQGSCSGSASFTVTVNPVPLAVINPSPTASICASGSVTLSAVTDIGTHFLWSPGGATTQTMSATSAGPHTVTITNNATGCSATSAATTVNVNSPPTITINAIPPSATVCAGNSVTLNASGGVSYEWSNGMVGPSITVSASGTYTVTGTDANGCSNTASQVVTINPLPNVSFSGLASSYCEDDCAGYLLTGNPPGGSFTYSGSSGFSSNTFTPCDAEAGTYTFTYTYTDGNGCTNSATQTTTVHPVPEPEITPLTGTTVCFGNNVILTTQAAAQYLWSNGATTQSITLTQVAHSGSYTVEATNAFGCSATSDPITVTIHALPTPVVSIVDNLPPSICEGETLDLTTSSYSSYLWQPGLQTTQTITVSATGNYRVTVTDGNGCSGTSPIQTITVHPNPVPTISGSLSFCTGESTTLTSSAASSYSWTPGGEITQSIVVTVAGTYSVEVTDANGCQGTASVDVVETPVNPVITPIGSTTFCQGGSVTLYSSSPVGNLWLPSGETTQFITVTTQGTVTLNVTSGSCQGTDQIEIIVNPLPTVSFSGLNSAYCNNAASVTLTGNPSGGTFSGPGISGNTFNPAAAGNGVHTITYSYTDGNGCSNSASQNVTVNNLPTVSFSGLAGQYCENNPVVTLFGSPSGGTFSGTGISGNTFNPGVGAGVYVITYTYSDGNGCENSSSQTVTVHAVPTVTFNLSDTDYCENESAVTLSGSPAGGTFSGNGVVGSQFFPSIPGAGAHLITYTVTNGFGCTSSASQTINVHAIPTVSFSGFNASRSYCIDASTVTLTGSPLGGVFTGNGISGNTFNPATAGTGVHVITYTYNDGFGCVNSSSQAVTVYPLPPAVATPLGSTTFCQGQNLILYSNSGTGNVWNPGGQTTQFISVNQAGSYTVTVTDANGCTATSAPVVVTVNPLPEPVIVGNGPLAFCQGGSVTLSTTQSYDQYFWSNGVNTPTNTVSASDDYTVTVTDNNGCSNTSQPITVTVHPLPPADLVPSGTVNICNGASVTLQATGGVSYVWQPNGETTSSIIVAVEGTYYATVTDANGCSAVTPSANVVVNSNPVPTITAFGPTTFCQGQNVLLMASAGTQYLWSPNGETNQIISATASGSYTVTIHDANGCSGTSAPVTVIVNPLPNVSFSGLANQYCIDASPSILTVNPSGGFFTGPVTGNTFNPGLAGVGTHVITYHFTNGNGCSNSHSQTVEVYPLPVVDFSGLDTEYCIDEPAVTLAGSPFGGTFTGTGISGQQFNPALAGAGTHAITYTYTDGNGCTNSITKSVTVHPLPTVNFFALASAYCIDAPAVTLIGSPAGGTFTGQGMTGNVFNPGDAGVGTWNITYTYTDDNGCTNFSTNSVTVNPLPVVTFAPLASQYCITISNVLLSGTPSGGIFTGAGVTGNVFNPSLAGVGSHLLTYTYTDANGCVNFATQTAVVVPLPVVSFTGLEVEYCVNESASALVGNPSGGTFSGMGVSGNTFNPAQAGVGTHTVIYTYTDGFGCTNSTAQSTTVHPLPLISFSGLSIDYCLDETPATLTGNPSTGVFSGPGVSANLFYPSVAGAGTHTVVFAYTDINGCTGTLSQNTTVYDLPVVTINPVTDDFCVTETTVTLSATPAGGVFSGVGVSGTNFNPSVAGVGTHDVYYDYTDINGCSNSDVIQITVVPLPAVSIDGLALQYCVDADAVTLTGIPAGGVFSGNGITGDDFSPADAGVGSANVTYTYTDGNGCTSSITQTTVVSPLPVVSITGFMPEYCVDGFPVTLTGNPAGGVFSGNGMNGSVFTPADAGVGAHVITYDYTDANGCSATTSETIIVNELPSAEITNTVVQFCVSETQVDLTADPAGGTFSGVSVAGSVFNPAFAGVGTHVISYFYSDGNGCEITVTKDFEVLPLPVPDFTGLGAQYCEDGQPVQLTGIPDGGFFSGNGMNGDIFTPADAGIGPIGITYTYTDDNGCTGSTTQTTNVYSLPIVQFSGLFDAYCFDAEPAELTGIPSGGAFFGNGIINGNFFSPASAGIGTHTITYAHQNSVGCIGTTQQTTVVHSLPAVSFTGLGTIYCLESDSVVLTGSPDGGWFDGPALNNNVFYPEYAGTGTHTITYYYFDSNGCSGEHSQTTTVYQLAQPQVNASGPIAFCEGDDVTLTAQPPFVSYLWSNGETTQSVTVNTQNDFFVTIQDVNGCRATSETISTTVYPLPVVNLGPDIAVCQGTPVTLNAGTGFASYLWFPGGATTQSITVQTAGDYRASVTDANGCFNYDEVTVVIHQPEVPTITSSGQPSICEGETLTLSAPLGFQSYNWSNGGTQFQIDVTQTGSYSVTTLDQNGCTATSAPYNVTVMPLPIVTIYASGPTEICQGQNLTLFMPSGYAYYEWSTGATTNSILVNQSGFYFGTATNSAGCSNVTSIVEVTVYPQPEPVITPQGPLTLCYGETIILDAGNQNYTSYNWYHNLLPMNVFSQYAEIGTSGSYTVEVIDQNGCGEGVTSPPVNVTVLPQLIPTITISQGQDTLFSSPAVTYQWYFNGQPISGANQQFYVPQQSGNYRVVVSDINSCEGVSAILEYSYSSIETLGANNALIHLFPNPGKGRFTLAGEFGTPAAVSIIVSDMLGNMLMPAMEFKAVQSLKQEISLEQFANGVYFVNIISDGSRKTIRYVKE